MTPEEHYRQAEGWLKAAGELDDTSPSSALAMKLFQQRAQVHATLATVEWGNK